MSEQFFNLYNASIGLNTKLDPQRLSNDPNKLECAQLVNVSIDDRGLISLREGYSELNTNNYSSIFCSDSDCFVVEERVSDAAIFKLISVSPLTFATVRTGLTKGQRMAWEQVNYDTFYSNGIQNGYIRSGVNYSWPNGTYYGPEADYQFDSTAPIANHIAVMPWMQMALAVGSAIFLNHLPFQFGLYERRLGGIGFGSNVLMLCPVASGFFVSDEEKIWFFQKLESWYHYKQIKVADYPALLGSLAYDKVLLSDIKIDSPGYGRVWASPEGICLGLDNGLMLNLTDEQINYLKTKNYGACLIQKTKLIHTAW